MHALDGCHARITFGLRTWACRRQRAVNRAVHHVHRQNLHAVPPRVGDELVGRVKPQWLAVEHGGQKLGRVMALEPTARVDQQRKTGGVAFWKAVFRKSLDLLEDGLCEAQLIAVGRHAMNEALTVLVQITFAAPGGHGTAQAIGLAGAEVGRDHGDLHHLLLKNGHTQRALERIAQFLAV